ncbi:hypothetical protein Fcan01_26458 [Folsomia candida]|uniref:Uncharacterized protein n=1 Tax=Folsomia candida TaxID=158441 RepID=A0A226CZN5_FOLCA|nr:hypothetical protein Fcan01_26458 [Folsomia candida]
MEPCFTLFIVSNLPDPKIFLENLYNIIQPSYLTYRPETSYILIDPWTNPINRFLLLKSFPFSHDYQASWFLWRVRSSKKYLLCLFCEETFIPVQHFGRDDVNFGQLWGTSDSTIFIFDAAHKQDHGIDRMPCPTSPWLLGKKKTKFRQLKCTRGLILFQTVAHHLNLSHHLRYQSSSKSPPSGTRLLGEVTFNTIIHPSEGVDMLVPLGVFVTIKGLDMFYCQLRYHKENDVSYFGIWASAFPPKIWICLLTVMTVTAIVLSLDLNGFHVGESFTKFFKFARELLRQPAPSGGDHYIILLTSAALIILLMSYENSITSKIIAPVRIPPAESILHLIKAGYRINYPYFAGVYSQGLKPTEYLAVFLKIFGRDFEAMKITKETYNFKELFDFQSFDAIGNSQKLYLRSIHTLKFVVIDKTATGAIASTIQTFLPMCDCYTIQTLLKMHRFDLCRMPGQEVVAKLTRKLQETGIQAFWRGMEDQLVFRFLKRQKIFAEALGNLILIKHLYKINYLCLMILLGGGVVWLEYAPVRQPPVESIIDLLIAGYRIKYPYFAGDFTQELKSTEYLTEFLKMFGRDFDAMKIRKETYDFKKLFDFQSFGETEDSEKTLMRMHWFDLYMMPGQGAVTTLTKRLWETGIQAFWDGMDDVSLYATRENYGGSGGEFYSNEELEFVED